MRDVRGQPDKSRAGVRHRQGTPQGGVISPLLANLYLHWFDKLFHRADGPAHWAQATLIRYADDFVILAKGIDERLVEWTETVLEGRFGLKINREKTGIRRLSVISEDEFSFLGYTFRYEWDRYGKGKRFLSLFPSGKAIARERENLRQIINCRNKLIPLSDLVGSVNRQLQGWWGYFAHGHSWKAMQAINRFVFRRLCGHLRRRSQRPMKPPPGMSWTTFMTQQLGLEVLSRYSIARVIT